MQVKMSYKHRVLQDHLKFGNTFYPPFTFDGRDSRFTDVNWRADILPELIWIGLLVQRYGFEEAREMACSFAFLADQSYSYGYRPNFGTVSGYCQISERLAHSLNEKLSVRNLGPMLSKALTSLIILYPKCPLRFILNGASPELDQKEAATLLSKIILILDRLFDFPDDFASYFLSLKREDAGLGLYTIQRD